MPRIYVDEGGEDVPYDCCVTCFLEITTLEFADEHPDYDDEEYTCEECGVTLTGKDN